MHSKNGSINIICKLFTKWCFYPAFQSISVILWIQLTLFLCMSWVSQDLGRALTFLAEGHSYNKTQRIQCGSNPGPLDYESNTLPMSHTGPHKHYNHHTHEFGIYTKNKRYVQDVGNIFFFICNNCCI